MQNAKFNVMHIANVTSQGQVSIPIKLRRKFELDKRKQVLITEENGKIIIEPAKDILDLAGSLHKYAKKNMSIDKIIALEKKAVADAVVGRYKRSLKRSGLKPIIIKPTKKLP